MSVSLVTQERFDYSCEIPLPPHSAREAEARPALACCLIPSHGTGGTVSHTAILTVGKLLRMTEEWERPPASFNSAFQHFLEINGPLLYILTHGRGVKISLIAGTGMFLT